MYGKYLEKFKIESNLDFYCEIIQRCAFLWESSGNTDFMTVEKEAANLSSK